MRIAICEDNPIHAKILMRMIEKWQEKVSDQVIKTEVFQSAEQFLCSIDEDAQSVFDLAFLDIGLKRMDGMELAKRLREENNHMIIVFTTADALSATKGYEVEAFRYLVKPLHGDHTGILVENVTNLSIHKYLAGHLGGKQQLGSQIEHNQMDLLIFFRDPLTPHSHEPDVNDIVKLCDIYNIPIATNIATAEALILALDRGDLDWREMYR